MVTFVLIASAIVLAGFNHGADAIISWFHSLSFNHLLLEQNPSSSVDSPPAEVPSYSEESRGRAARLKEFIWFCLTAKQVWDSNKNELITERLKVLLWFCLTTRKVRLRNKKDHISKLPDELVSDIISLLAWKESFRTSVLSSTWKRIRTTMPPRTPCYSFHEKDFISRMPDRILADILSSLPLKEAYRTSILSSRWRRICEIMPRLHIPGLRDMFRLRTCNISYTFKYKKVVRECLRTYPSRKVFSLEMNCCFIEHIGLDFMWWMYDVGNRMGIQVLDICFDCPARCRKGKFPRVDFNPFDLSSLHTLTLSRCRLVFELRGGLNSIKTLSLYDVILDTNSTKCILSCCWTLESWILDTCVLPSKLHISSGRSDIALKLLRINNCKAFEMSIRATNLVTFEYNDFQCNKKFHAEKIRFSNVPSLENISLASSGKAFMHYAFDELGNRLPRLKYLMVNTHQNEVQYLPRKIHDNAITLPNPKAIKRTNWFGYPPRLTEVEISGFCGFPEHFEFAEFVLGNIATLERLYISNGNKYYAGEGKWTYAVVKQWTPNERIMINQLQAKALSPEARVVVR